MEGRERKGGEGGGEIREGEEEKETKERREEEGERGTKDDTVKDSMRQEGREGAWPYHRLTNEMLSWERMSS